MILVSGFNRMGLHNTLFNVVRLFGSGVGIVDADKFKGKDEIARLEEHVKDSLDKYVSCMRQQGFYARAYPLIGTDVMEDGLHPCKPDFSQNTRTAFSLEAASSSRMRLSCRGSAVTTLPLRCSVDCTSSASPS